MEYNLETRLRYKPHKLPDQILEAHANNNEYISMAETGHSRACHYGELCES